MSVLGRHALTGPTRLAFGALTLDVEARRSEWRLSSRYGEELDHDEVGPCPDPLPPGAERHALVAEPALDVAAALPDTDTVVRTDPPISVAPATAVTVYVGTPLWLSLRAADHLLAEVPSVRMRRTWFGPSVREGELLLAIRSLARLDLGELRRRPHRAITALRVENHDVRPFSLERLKVPLPHLALWRATGGQWWTDGVHVVRGEGSSAATLAVAPRPPEEAGEVVRVAEPRRREAPNPVLRALDALFS